MKTSLNARENKQKSWNLSAGWNSTYMSVNETLLSINGTWFFNDNITLVMYVILIFRILMIHVTKEEEMEYGEKKCAAIEKLQQNLVACLFPAKSIISNHY